MPWTSDEAKQIGRIEAKLDDSLEHLKDHEVRLRSTERWRNALTGAWAVLALIGGVLFRVLWSRA
jgi:hypothetical protein